MELNGVHFLSWDDSLKKELRQKIIDRFQDALPSMTFEDIIVSGSRVMLPQHPVFKPNSDLDVSIIVSEKDFYKVFDTDALFHPDTPGKRASRLKGFDFYGVYVSLFVRPSEIENGRYRNYFYKFNLSYYSLVSMQLFIGDLIDEVDYYTHIKPRIEKFSFCYVCKQFKDAPNVMELTMRKRGQLYIPDSLQGYNRGYIYLCNACANVIGHDIKELIYTITSYRFLVETED